EWTIGGGAPLSAFATNQHEHHRLRRSALNPFFSGRSVRALEPVILQTVDRLCARFDEASHSGEVVRLDAAYMALTMDVICVYVFGASEGHLEAADYNAKWKEVILDTA